MTLEAAQGVGESPCLKLLWAIAIVLCPEPTASTAYADVKNRAANWRGLLRVARRIYSEMEPRP